MIKKFGILILIVGKLAASNGSCPVTELLCGTKRVVNCVKCVVPQATSDRCEVCVTGNSPNAAGDECQVCPENCRDCTGNKDDCTQCLRGFYRYEDTTGNFICRTCKEDCEHCSTEALCLKCKTGYYRDTTDAACLTCPNECSACEGKTKCSNCSDGYYPDASNGIGCSKCSLDGCVQCADVATCLLCSEGFYIQDGACAKNPEIITEWIGLKELGSFFILLSLLFF